MTIYSGFSHWKWWFSIVMLVYQRVFHNQWDSYRCELRWPVVSRLNLCRGSERFHEVWSADPFPTSISWDGLGFNWSIGWWLQLKWWHQYHEATNISNVDIQYLISDVNIPSHQVNPQIFMIFTDLMYLDVMTLRWGCVCTPFLGGSNLYDVAIYCC